VSTPATTNGDPRAETGAQHWTPVTLVVNGVERTVVVANDRRLVDVLRDDFGLTGSKVACEVAVCGVCTVLVDGLPTSSCIMLAAQADGREIVTVEGLEANPQWRALQEAFITEGGFQCGFCTSGQLVAAASLLVDDEVDSGSREEIQDYMLGNLCRCTGYYGILRAIEKAAACPSK
jgi:aerobic-type carbon monoxide dehydrogenase small subunit (CoxS/CutS family)